MLCFITKVPFEVTFVPSRPSIARAVITDGVWLTNLEYVSETFVYNNLDA